MLIKDVRFFKSAQKVKDFPDYDFPEFAFFGRSNVGKSSLINMITGRKSLVKVGGKPGVTRLVNFFLVNDNISIADLPGFGFAQLPKNVRDGFWPMITGYIKSRDNLRLTFLLVDIRRIPGDLERELVIKLTEKKKPVAVVATKCDKLSKNQRAVSAAKIAAEFNIKPGSIYFASSKTGEGKKEIHELIDEFSA